MEDLKDLRTKLTEIDNQMADLFTRRMELVAAVDNNQDIFPVCDLSILGYELLDNSFQYQLF